MLATGISCFSCQRTSTFPAGKVGLSLRPSKGMTECRRRDHFCGSNTIQYINYAEILKPELENYLSPGFREYQTEAFQAVVGTLQKAGHKCWVEFVIHNPEKMLGKLLHTVLEVLVSQSQSEDDLLVPHTVEEPSKTRSMSSRSRGLL